MLNVDNLLHLCQPNNFKLIYRLNMRIIIIHKTHVLYLGTKIILVQMKTNFTKSKIMQQYIFKDSYSSNSTHL